MKDLLVTLLIFVTCFLFGALFTLRTVQIAYPEAYAIIIGQEVE